ncbi:hypothetical protein KHU50_009092 [Colletotrichum sp. SAR 10_65]|nr:hypothetical protein KHU50_009092 [Colletotrichum sp. SAR 10_65]
MRSESPYDGPSGPSHPYQMYPQRTNSVATSSTARMSERSYAGPRGPTHPYTLYTQNTVPVDSGEVMAASVPPAVIPGAGGLGLATRNPEFESREDLRLPSRMSSRTLTSDTASQHEINTAAEAYAEKATDRKWQKRAKKRMFGVIPYWAICLLAVGLVLM